MSGDSHRLLRLSLGWAIPLLLSGEAQSAPRIRNVAPVDVTSSSFAIAWEMTEAATPGIAIYADAAGTSEITGDFDVIPTPLQADEPAPEALRDRIRSLGVAKIEVRGAAPQTTYYYRALARGAGGEIAQWPAGPPASVSTSKENAFVADAKQLLVAVGDGAGALEPTGWLVTAKHADNPYPVSAFVADGAPAGRAFLNLANLFGPDGTNWTPLGSRRITLEVRRGLDGEPFAGRISLDYTGTFRVAVRVPAEVREGPPLDTDGDGLTDAWEIENFGTLERDGDGDFDDDGLADKTEFTLGTDPTASNLPIIPVLVSPDKVKALAPEVTIETRIPAGGPALAYDFELHADEGYRVLVASERSPFVPDAVLTWTVPLMLDDNTRYFLRVRAIDGYSASEWVHGTFFVDTAKDAPGAFAVSAPADGSQVDTTSPVLEVTNSTDADEDRVAYDFAVYADPAMIALVASAAGLEEDADGTTSWRVDPPLADGAEYFWRATARDPDGLETVTPLAAFTVNTARGAPDAPAIFFPAPGEEVDDLEITITVENARDPDGDPLSYFFEVDTVKTFDGDSLVRSGAIAEGVDRTAWWVSGLSDNTRYYVRVRASDGLMHGPWTNGHFFVSTAPDPPSKPIARNPGGDAWVAGRMQFLEVHRPEDPDRDPVIHRFELYRGVGLGERAAWIEADRPAWLLPFDLADVSWYTWRARAEDLGGAASDWMDPVAFLSNARVVEPPRADAGPDRNALAGRFARLDGSGSFDPGGRRLSYAWSFLGVPRGSALADESPEGGDAAVAGFVPDAEGVYLLRLRVTNGILADSDTVAVAASSAAFAPNARAGKDRTALTGSPVTVDGGASDDPDTDPGALRYGWRFRRVPPASALKDGDIDGRDTSRATFVPDADGLYLLGLTVGDGEHSLEDTVGVFAAAAEVPPNADAGADLAVASGEEAILDGRGSDDPDAGPGPFTYAWRFVSVPEASGLTEESIGGADTPTPSFTPDAAGVYVLELEVGDGKYRDIDHAAVLAEGVPPVTFIRGNANASGGIDIGDAICILRYLFVAGTNVACIDATDINDDGRRDIGDPISLLNWLFANGPAPAPPLEACGVDPTPEDPLSCESFPPCE